MAPAFAANSSVGDFDSNAARLRCSFPPISKMFWQCSSSNHGHKAELGGGACAKKFVGSRMSSTPQSGELA